MEVKLTIANICFILFLLCCIVALCPSPIQQLFLAFFRRGKLLRLNPTSPKRGIMERFTVPQRFFLHFYMVGALSSGVILLSLLLYIFLMPTYMGRFKMEGRDAWRSVLLLCLLEAQILRRLYENMFLSKFSRTARMSLLGYVGGILYYAFVSFLVFPRAEEFFMSLIQGLMSRELGEFKINLLGWKPLFEIGWLYWLSSVLFMWGWQHQYQCHSILASLRSKEEEDSNTYKIPYGDWFEYVSSAHYFAELVMYFSFVVAMGGRNFDIWLLFSVVVCNLWITAVETHKWYKEKFEDYPVSRKAIIPFVF